jgi:hypothetical protein
MILRVTTLIHDVTLLFFNTSPVGADDQHRLGPRVNARAVLQSCRQRSSTA